MIERLHDDIPTKKKEPETNQQFNTTKSHV